MSDEELCERLLSGDEEAFSTLVRRYHGVLVRVARYYVRTEASAEDVAQETWIAVLRGVAQFEGRSSFRTWLLHIAANRARTMGTKESKSVNVDPTWAAHDDLAGRFDRGGAWNEPPIPFTDRVHDGVANEPVLRIVRDAIAHLPEPQRTVVTLRDVQGLSTMEVAGLLELSESNIRVILHRGRNKVRGEIESSVGVRPS